LAVGHWISSTKLERANNRQIKLNDGNGESGNIKAEHRECRDINVSRLLK